MNDQIQESRPTYYLPKICCVQLKGHKTASAIRHLISAFYTCLILSQ